MKIKSSLYICEHPTDGEPHATAIVDVPLKDALENPQLAAMYHGMGAEEQAMVRERGSLALSQDYSFLEEYKDGVGLVMEGLSLDVNRLKPEARENIVGWMGSAYGAGVTAESSNQAIAAAVDANKEHIITDMTVSGMSREAFLELAGQAKSGQVSDDSLISQEQAEHMLASIKQRNGGELDEAALGAYHDQAITMADRWPSAKDKNYGGESPDEGRVVFYTGFEAKSETLVKAGPYAFVSAWPANTAGVENGVHVDDNGKPVAIRDIKVDEDYVYYPKSALTAEYRGEKAEQIVAGLLDSAENSQSYNGFDRNCVGISGQGAFGEDYAQIRDAAGHNGKVTNAGLLEHLEQGGQLPQGIGSHEIKLQGEKSGEHDHNRLQEAEKQAPENQGKLQGRNNIAELSGDVRVAAVAAAKGVRDVIEGRAAHDTGVPRGKQQDPGQQIGGR